jgi:hypothetical protein
MANFISISRHSVHSIKRHHDTQHNTLRITIKNMALSIIALNILSFRFNVIYA